MPKFFDRPYVTLYSTFVDKNSHPLQDILVQNLHITTLTPMKYHRSKISTEFDSLCVTIYLILLIMYCGGAILEYLHHLYSLKLKTLLSKPELHTS